MKRLSLWLIATIFMLTLFSFSLNSYGAEDDITLFTGDPETYDVGVDKTVEAYKAFRIEYKNTVTGKDQATLEGTFNVHPRLKIIYLELDYSVMDGDYIEQILIPLSLNPTDNPLVYEFKSVYSMDLAKYEYEIFGVTIIAEEVKETLDV